jgi:Siphovirus Gp157
MTRTLFDISQDLHGLADQLDNLEGDDEAQTEAVIQWFEELGQERDQKLDNYAALIAEIEARAQVRRDEAKRLVDRARIDENKAALLKERLRVFFESHSLKTVETSRYRLTLAQNGGKLPLLVDVSVDGLPEEYIRLSKAPALDAIRADLEAGKELPFARFGERGSSIRIK